MVAHLFIYAFAFGVYGIASGAGEAEDLDDDGVGCERTITLALCLLPLAYAALIAVGAALPVDACLWTGVGLLSDWVISMVAIARGWAHEPDAALRERFEAAVQDVLEPVELDKSACVSWRKLIPEEGLEPFV